MNESTENSKTKAWQLGTFIGFVLFVMLVLAIFMWMLSNKTNESTKSIEKLQFSDALNHAEPESTLLEQVQKGLEDAKKETENLKIEINRNSPINHNKQKELEDRLAFVEKKLEV